MNTFSTLGKMQGVQGGPVWAWFVLSLPPRTRAPISEWLSPPPSPTMAAPHWVLQNWRAKASGQDSSWDAAEMASWLPCRPLVGHTGPLAIALFQVTISLWSSVFYKQTFPEKATPVLRTLQSWLTNRNSVIVGSWSVTNPDPIVLKDIHGSLLWPKTLRILF